MGAIRCQQVEYASGLQALVLARCLILEAEIWTLVRMHDDWQYRLPDSDLNSYLFEKNPTRCHRAARDKNNTTNPKHILYSRNQFGAGRYAYLYQSDRAPMSQASLPTPKSSECSNRSAVGLEPDRRHSAALKPSLSSCVACRTY